MKLLLWNKIMELLNLRILHLFLFCNRKRELQNKPYRARYEVHTPK